MCATVHVLVECHHDVRVLAISPRYEASNPGIAASARPALILFHMSFNLTGQFPTYRLRRLRQSPAMRRLVAETRLSIDQLVLPLFAVEGKKIRRAVSAMPGVFQLSI